MTGSGVRIPLSAPPFWQLEISVTRNTTHFRAIGRCKRREFEWSRNAAVTRWLLAPSRFTQLRTRETDVALSASCGRQRRSECCQRKPASLPIGVASLTRRRSRAGGVAPGLSLSTKARASGKCFCASLISHRESFQVFLVAQRKPYDRNVPRIHS
jgi:hypothetical protein